MFEAVLHCGSSLCSVPLALVCAFMAGMWFSEGGTLSLCLAAQ